MNTILTNLLDGIMRSLATISPAVDILEKYAVVLGTLLFGIVDQMFSMRNSVLFPAVFFLAGMLVLTTVKIQSAKMSE